MRAQHPLHACQARVPAVQLPEPGRTLGELERAEHPHCKPLPWKLPACSDPGLSPRPRLRVRRGGKHTASASGRRPDDG